MTSATVSKARSVGRQLLSVPSSTGSGSESSNIWAILRARPRPDSQFQARLARRWWHFDCRLSAS